MALALEQIKSCCDDKTFQRGLTYFEEKRVSNLEVYEQSKETLEFRAQVKGSKSTLYRQTIDVQFYDNDYADIEGFCSCPVEYNCKHVVAACLQLRSQQQNPDNQSVSLNKAMSWLDRMQQQSSDDKEAPNSINQRRFVIYILKYNDMLSELDCYAYKTYYKKVGGLAKLQKLHLAQIDQYNYSPIDEEIANLLESTAEHYYSSSYKISANSGHVVLQKLLETERCYLQSTDNPPITLGKTETFDLKWELDDKQNYELKYSFSNPRAKLLALSPAWYIDEQDHQVGMVENCPFNIQQIKSLKTAPKVKKQEAEEFSQQLLVHFPDLKVPTPEKISMRELSGTQLKPHLRIFGQKNNDRTVHFARLSFIYDGCAIDPFPQEKLSFSQQQHQIIKIHRESEKENQYLNEMRELGFEMAENTQPRAIFFSPGYRSISDSAARWQNFLENEIPRLEDLGWGIDVDDSFELRFHDELDWDAQFEESGNNWFELSFELEFEGEKVNLLPVVSSILKEHELGELPEKFVIPVGQYDYVTLTAKQIEPIVAVINELYDHQGPLKVSLHDAATLVDFNERYEQLQLKGAQKLLEIGQKLQQFEGIKHVAVPKQLKAQLRDYQQIGLNWLQFLREYQLNGILADDMGLGKTLQTLTHILIEKQEGRLTSPCLVVAPTSLMSNWRREAEQFCPDLKVLIWQGSQRRKGLDKIIESDIVLTTYPLLPRDQELFLERQWHILILDEAQMIKNPKSQASKIVREIQSNHRLCLTGTPMENHTGELWALFDFLMPGFLHSDKVFKEKYRNPIEKGLDATVSAQLAKRVSPFLLRRTKSQVATELPEKTEIIRSVPFAKQQAVLYESVRLSMEKSVRDAIKNKGLARSHITILDALLKLRQVCCDPQLVSLQQAKSVQESAKLDLLMDLLPEMLEEGRRVLLFSQFTSMLSIIEERLSQHEIGYTKLTGQTRKREEVIDRFKNGEVDVFLISLKAGGVGLNLTEADTVIIYDPWWNPAVEDQAADRCYRIGQDKPVFVYKLMIEDSVEEKILAMQQRKKELAESMYGEKQLDSQPELTAEFINELLTRS